LIARILIVFGLDKAVFITLMARAWSIFAGLSSIYFLTRFLTPELQGYYYTFASLITLQLFVELGLTYAIVQFSSHEMAALVWTPEGVVAGSAKEKRRLQSILYFATSWFVVGALIMVLFLVPLGLHFFDNAPLPIGTSRQNIALPWVLLVCAASANIVITAFAAVLEGCGKVAEVATFRFYQALFSVITVWVVLSMGGHLFALPASSLMAGMVGLALLIFKHRLFFLDLYRCKIMLPGVSWRREILPFQWRIALSWSSGFLIFNMFNPLLFANHGPVVAGQMGMSLQIISALNNAAMAWITTKIPTYGNLIATKQIAKLNTLFFRGLSQSFVFLIFSVASVLSIIFYLYILESSYTARVLPLTLLVILGIVCITNHIVFAEAAYLRAFKEEPFMIISLLNGLVTAFLAVFLIPPFGAAGAVFSYALGAVLIALGGGTLIFIQKFKKMKEEANL
jgi:O-antigen/teichoic acid export membrane protein